MSKNPNLRIAIPLVLLASVASPPLAGQVVPVDDAVFVLYRNGQAVGEEHVTVHRMGLGQDARVIGQSEVRLQDGTEMRPRLEANADMRPTTYQNKFTGPETGEVLLSRAGRRLVARTQSASGEAQREFRVSDRMVILESEIVLLYYFLLPWVGQPGVELTVLEPRSGRQGGFVLNPVGTERLRFGRLTISAEHLRLEAGEDVREVWFDEDGRVMRVVIPGTGFSAERRES